MNNNMDDLFPEDIPWLTQNENYLNGVEVGAMLMLCKLGAPLIKMKIHPINEDQIRVGAGHIGYHVMVDGRDDEWAYITLATKTELPQDTTNDE